MPDLLFQARELHRRYPLIDTHSHFLINGYYFRKKFHKRHRPQWLYNPLRNAIDLPRLQEGGVSCSTFTIWTPGLPLDLSAWNACNRMIDMVTEVVAQSPDQMTLAQTAAEIRSAHSAGKVSALLAVEGGHVIGKKLERLATMRERGIRLLTVAHLITNRLCDSNNGPRIHKGLSPLGREVVKTCEQLGIVVDLSHATEPGFYQALEFLDKPPMVTHTAIRDKRGSHRFLTDDQIRALGQAGGAMGVIMWPWYLKSWGIATHLDFVVDTYVRMAELAGPQHLLIGTDIDGYIWYPRGFSDVTDFPVLTAKLLERGFSEDEVAGILGGNALRVLEAWE
jgi:membrane dipeptidase